jgi:hypothetical protein
MQDCIFDKPYNWSDFSANLFQRETQFLRQTMSQGLPMMTKWSKTQSQQARGRHNPGGLSVNP